MITGAELYQKFQQNIGKPYTGYYDVAKANRAYKEAYPFVIQDIYNNRLERQNEWDEMSYLVALNQARVPTANKVFHRPIPITSVTYVGSIITIGTEIEHNLVPGDTFTPLNIDGTLTFVADLNGTLQTVATIVDSSTFTYDNTIVPTGAHTAGTGELRVTKSYWDYSHLLYAQLRFIQPSTYAIVDATNSSPIRISFAVRNSLRSGSRVRITGALGNTNANGDWYLKQLNEKLYGLYSDENFQVPSVGNAAYTGGASLSLISEREMKPKFYDQKGAIYGFPTPNSPYFQQGLLQFYLYPLSIPCERMTLDYIRRPPIEIDCGDNNIDFERYYPEFFLDKVAFEAARKFGFNQRDGALVTGMTEEIIENP